MSLSTPRVPSEGPFRAQSPRSLLDRGLGRPPGRAGFILHAEPGTAHSGVPTMVALPSPTGKESVPLEPASPPFPIVEEIQLLVRKLYELRISVEHRMEALKEAFNASMPRSRLRLRPWSRRKGEPPYAVYWIFLTRKQRTFENRTWQAIESRRPRWFKRLKIRTRRDLDLAIHRAGMDAVRRQVHRFHDDVLALNESHRALARATDSIRRMLSGRAAGKGLTIPPVPEELEGRWLPDEVLGVTRSAWRLECLTRRTTNDLALVSRLQSRQPGWIRYRLEFRQGKDHPYGHLVWRDLETRSTYACLDDRTKRRLGIPAPMRGVLTPFELNRRELIRELKSRTSLLRRIRTKAGRATEVAQENLDRLNRHAQVGNYPEHFSENWRSE
jgi:hypothetical protein